jgi:integrase/recombinase XerD
MRRARRCDCCRVQGINRDEGTTLAFSKQDARKLLDLPKPHTDGRRASIEGLRDRAILSVGLQVGLRRAEIASPTVGDPHQTRGYDSLRVVRKGDRRDALAINPQTAGRLRDYLAAAGHPDDMDGPLVAIRRGPQAKMVTRIGRGFHGAFRGGF